MAVLDGSMVHDTFNRFQALAVEVQRDAIAKAKAELVTEMDPHGIEQKVIACLDTLKSLDAAQKETARELAEAQSDMDQAEAALKMTDEFIKCSNDTQRKAWLAVMCPKDAVWSRARARVQSIQVRADNLRIQSSDEERRYSVFKEVLRFNTARLEFLAR